MLVIESLVISLEFFPFIYPHTEAVTDLHNMTLFLQRDSARDTPAGFEKPCYNFFDPETPSLENAADDIPKEDPTPKAVEIDAVAADPISTSISASAAPKEEGNGIPPAVSTSSDNDDDAGTKAKKKTNLAVCARGGCEKKCRFDSIFCSDACGVAVVEADLLKSLELASTLHPSVLTRNAQYT